VVNPELSYDIKNYIVFRSNLRPKMFRADVILSETDTNLILTAFDKQKKTYAFVNLNYNKTQMNILKVRLNI